MKRLIYPVFVAFAMASCSKKEADQAMLPARLNKDSLSLGMMYLDQAYRHIGKDSVNLFDIDPVYKIYRKEVFSAFPYRGEGPIMLYTGREFANTVIAGPARTFSIFMRVAWPSGLVSEWDQERGTLVVSSKYTPDLVRLILPEKSAYIDPAHSRIIHSLNAGRRATEAGIDPYVTFIYEDIDPKLGKVTYKLRLKQLYSFVAQTEFQGYHALYAMY